ncbi:hypothetical protein D3C87_1502880 [compost metagenome]
MYFAIDQDVHKVKETDKNQSIYVSLILEVILQILPMDELELPSGVSEKLISDSKTL